MKTPGTHDTQSFLRIHSDAKPISPIHSISARVEPPTTTPPAISVEMCPSLQSKTILRRASSEPAKTPVRER